jgi:hypothetical protein
MDRLTELSGGISPFLTSPTIGFAVPGTIGTDVMPFHAIEGDRGTVLDRSQDIEPRKIHDTKMGIRSEPRDVSWGAATKDVLLVLRGLKSAYGTQEAERGATIGLDVASEAVNAAQTGVLVEREKTIADKVQDATNYAATHSVTVLGGSGWNEMTGTTSNIDPITHAIYGLMPGYSAIRAKIGTGPNQIVFGWEAWQAFINNTYVIARLGQNMLVREVDVATGLAILQKTMPSIKQLLIGESTYHNGTTFVDCWGDFCRLAYVDPNPQPRRPTPTWGYTLGRRYAVQDGVPLLGVAGSWKQNDFVSYGWYTEQRLEWVAWEDAGYLISDIVQ